MKRFLFPLLMLSVLSCSASPLFSQEKGNVQEKDNANGKDEKKAPAKRTAAETPLTAGSLAKMLIFSKEITRVTKHKTKVGLPDYPAALNEHFGRDVLPEENGAVLLYEAFGAQPEDTQLSEEFFELLGMPVPADDGEYFQFFTAGFPPEERRAALDDEFDPAYSRPWKKDEFPRIAKWLRDNEKPVAKIIEAASRPKYFSPLVPSVDEHGTSSGLISTLLPGIQQSRAVGRYLMIRCMLNIGHGRADAAWDDLLACHRLGHMISRGPTLIDFLVGVAIQQIASKGDVIYLDTLTLNADQLARCRRDLAALPPIESVVEKLDWTERMLYLDSAVMLGSGHCTVQELAGVVDAKPEGVESFVRRLALFSVDWNVVLRTGNEMYDRLIVAMKHKTYQQRSAALAVMEDELKESKSDSFFQRFLKANVKEGSGRAAVGRMMGDVLTGLLLPAISAVEKAHNRSWQTRHNLQVAFALAEWKLKHGSYPDSLEKLVPDSLQDAPVDSFTGQPLQYRLEGDGFLMYSVGMNLEDEKGRSFDDDPAGDDMVVRLPIPVPAVKDEEQDN